MKDDKKQPLEEANADVQKTPATNDTSATNEPENKEDEGTDWVAVGSGLGIDE